MPYLIADVELTTPLSPIDVPATHSGIGFIFRLEGRAIGFLLHPVSPGRTVGADEVERLATRQCGQRILQEESRRAVAAAGPPLVDPSVTVAICTRNHPDLVARCLASLRAAAARVPECRVELLVVDNAPPDELTREVAESTPGVRYTREPVPGLNFGRNRAMREATGTLVAYVDDDVVVDPRWLEGLLEAWRDNPDAGGFTGQVLPLELETDAQVLFERRGGFRRAFERIRWSGDSHPRNPLYPCNGGAFGAGANMAFRRELLLALGGWDEALDTGAPLPGGGDLDMFYRVLRAGRPLVYEPLYLAFHEHRREYDKLRHQFYTWGTGFVAFIEKSYRTDPPMRARWRRLIRWWLRAQTARVWRAARGRDSLPFDLVWPELWGGIVGLTGEYRRSLRRVQRLRNAHR